MISLFYFCSRVPLMKNKTLVAWLSPLVLLLTPSAPAADVIRLLLPQQNAVLRSNTPTLAWSAAAADHLEVWIDGVRLVELPGNATTHVAFPLSFGEHRWRVISVHGAQRTSSAEARFTIEDAPLARLPAGAVLLRRDWLVQSAATAGGDGARLSSPGVGPAGWAATSVPATVLTALVRNGVYPNPYVGLNNTRIPDAHDGFNAANDLLKFSHIPGQNPWAQPYWYRTRFAVPPAYAGKRVRLTFNEINYRAEVWLNGVRLAEPKDMVGMDRAFDFDVTDRVHREGENFLAVAIYPLDHPGRPEPMPVTPLADPGRNMGADMDISLNYTKWDAIGWDWQAEVHDRDIGITEDVFLSPFEEVEIKDVYVASELNLADVSRVGLLLAGELTNHGSTKREGTLRAVVSDDRGVALEVKQGITLAPGTASRIEWTPRNQAGFVLKEPRLWWPAVLGEPHLYTLTLEFRSADGHGVTQSVPFGVRKLETNLSPLTKTRVFKVNGRELYGQGGNWVIDMMLNWNASRYEQEIVAARQANLNFLRIWGPTGAPPDVFYDAADREGILLQQDFLHDHWGTERNTPGYAPPLDVFEQATTAIIKRYRNHPSLFLWCGGNEGPNPREELITGKLLPTFDPWGTRYYLSASLADGLQGGGPYHNLPAREYFNNPKIAGFNSEIGPSGVPEWESLREFLTLPISQWAPDRFPLDGTWAYHDATDRAGGEGERRKFSLLDNLIQHRYGSPATTDMAGLRDYAAKAQLLNYETYRAAVEALNAHLWEKSTGFAIWKYNSSWPSVLWQIADWYQRLHAGSYSFRRALEPLHVQLNLDDRSVVVINRTNAAAANLTVRAELLDSGMRSVWNEEQIAVNAKPGANATVLTVPARPGLTFLKLRMEREGKVISDNFYWLEPDDNFKALATLAPANVALRVGRAERDGSIPMTLSNQGTGLALLVRLRLIDAPTDVETLPAAWTDNYLNLLPGEKVEVRLLNPPNGLPPHPAVEVSGFNVAAAVVAF
jgi:hypothetical protein